MIPRPWRTLVDAPSLRLALGDSDVAILDCRHVLTDPEAGPRSYQEGHLPGAIHAHVDRDLSGPVGPAAGRHPLPNPERFREFLGRSGIGPGVQVVAYDDRGGAFAARAWWLLRHYGHRDVAVLDGGFPLWVASGLPVTTETRSRPPRTFKGNPGQMPTVEASNLTEGLREGKLAVVDVRDGVRYRGDQEPIDPVAGHIPGARNAPFGENLGADGKFLPPVLLRHRLEPHLQGRAPAETVAYCGSGVTAAMGILALEIAGFPGVALYPGSWSEWIRDPARPVARGPDAGTL